MPKKTRIGAEQIAKAKQLLHDLPQKEQDKSREETAVILEKSILRAVKKGYSVQEIGILLKDAGLPIPISLIRKVLSTNESQRKSSPTSHAHTENIG